MIMGFKYDNPDGENIDIVLIDVEIKEYETKIQELENKGDSEFIRDEISSLETKIEKLKKLKQAQ